jgi:K+-sensing histidine kinase KdpD
MKGQGINWIRPVALPTAATVVATLVTWFLWPYIAPTASPLFFLAVMISAVYGGVVAGFVATVLSAFSTAFFFMMPALSLRIGAADVFRLVVFAAVAALTNSIAAERNRVQAEERRLFEDLREANSRIRTLTDMLPLCPDCKRVRVGGPDGGWKTVERYLAETPELQITHALCPDCSARHFPEFQAADR